MGRKRKRHSLLGCKFSGSPKRLAQYYTEDFLGVGKYPDSDNLQNHRAEDVFFSAQAVIMHHLGYAMPKPPEEYLEQGFDVVVHYFCDPWWKGDRDSIEAMDKTYKRRQLHWFKEFAPGLLLGLLSERWDDLARVCAWIDARIRPEYGGGDVELELVHVYRSLAAGLRPERMPGLDNVEAKIRKCRLLRPKLLFQAWEAARKGDQEAFSAAFLKSLEHFESNFKPTGDFYAPMHWIAPHHSVVGLAAMRLGMELPELSPMQDAVVIRRESLGLANP